MAADKTLARRILDVWDISCRILQLTVVVSKPAGSGDPVECPYCDTKKLRERVYTVSHRSRSGSCDISELAVHIAAKHPDHIEEHVDQDTQQILEELIT